MAWHGEALTNLYLHRLLQTLHHSRLLHRQPGGHHGLEPVLHPPGLDVKGATTHQPTHPRPRSSSSWRCVQSSSASASATRTRSASGKRSVGSARGQRQSSSGQSRCASASGARARRRASGQRQTSSSDPHQIRRPAACLPLTGTHPALHTQLQCSDTQPPASLGDLSWSALAA
jgi:hypothetical protein